MSTVAPVQPSAQPSAVTPHVPAPVRRQPRIPSTRLGMWMFLASEVVIFGGLICCYLLLRLRHTEWLQESAHTLLPVGTINTVILLTSSLTMVLAHQAAQEKDRRKTKKFLLLTMGLALLFLCMKAFEYHHEIAEGRTPRESLFWTFYFAMTGMHAAHVLVGIIMMIYLYSQIKHDFVLKRVEPIGLYWHFVDVVWIVLFPLLYVTSH
jgi:heme/copper-type cytochrome/quinol oxidase subunit 3